MQQAETEMRYKQDEIIALRKAGMESTKKEEQLRNMKKIVVNGIDFLKSLLVIQLLRNVIL